MSIAEKLTTIAENQQKVYEVGKNDAHSEYINPEWKIWAYFSYKNNRNDLVAKLRYSDTSNGTHFEDMFYNCSALTEVPEIDTSNGTQFSYMFYYCSALTEIPNLNLSKATELPSMFYGCSRLTAIPEINTIKAVNFNKMFYNCTRLVTIPKLNLSGSIYKTTTYSTSASAFNQMFYNCKALENVTFEDYIYISASTSFFETAPNITVDSLMSFINALVNLSGSSTTYTVTIGSTNLAKLTAEQIQIATDKNITLA